MVLLYFLVATLSLAPYLVPLLICAPIVQTRLQRAKQPYKKFMAPLIGPLAAFVVTLHGFGMFHLLFFREFSRASIVLDLAPHSHVNSFASVDVYVCMFFILALPMLLLWAYKEKALIDHGCPSPKGPRILMAGIVVVSLVSGVTIDWVLRSYVSLEEAVRSNDIELARKRLAYNLEGLGTHNGQCVSDMDYGTLYFPLLPIAVEEGHHDMASLLIEWGADVDFGGNPYHAPHWMDVRSPVEIAAERNDMKMLQLLFDYGADATPAFEQWLKSDYPLDRHLDQRLWTRTYHPRSLIPLL